MTHDQTTVLAVIAYTLMQNARPEKAAALFEALSVLDPTRIDVLRGLAAAQVRSGKAERALRTLDKLALAGGADATFHLLRAQALADCARPLEAATAMQTYLAERAPQPARERMH